MSVLWIAFVIYIIGVAIVLYTRPGIMFRTDGGAWKEFGLSNKGVYTVFPFWLFAVLWAFMSYTVATISAVLLSSIALRSVPSSVSNDGKVSPNLMKILQDNLNNDIQPISSTVAPPKHIPGYYVLEQVASGLPKYVYFGENPPRV